MIYSTSIKGMFNDFVWQSPTSSTIDVIKFFYQYSRIFTQEDGRSYIQASHRHLQESWDD